jgi:hypothetical protein
VPKGLHVSSSIFDPGLTEVDQARTGATQALRPYGSEQWLTGRKSREERLSFSIQSSLTCGLQRFDDAEACDRDSPAEPAGKENGTRRDLGRPSLTRRSMNRGEWLRGLSRRAESTSAQLANGPRWWRAVSQRVPRDAYRRIAKTDVLGTTQHHGRRDAG